MNIQIYFCTCCMLYISICTVILTNSKWEPHENATKKTTLSKEIYKTQRMKLNCPWNMEKLTQNNLKFGQTYLEQPEIWTDLPRTTWNMDKLTQNNLNYGQTYPEQPKIWTNLPSYLEKGICVIIPNYLFPLQQNTDIGPRYTSWKIKENWKKI